MTTKGHARHNDVGLESILRRLPDMVARANEDGRPVIVEHAAGELEPYTQRLYATLGVLVRFLPVREDREAAQDREP